MYQASYADLSVGIFSFKNGFAQKQPFLVFFSLENLKCSQKAPSKATDCNIIDYLNLFEGLVVTYVSQPIFMLTIVYSNSLIFDILLGGKISFLIYSLLST